MSAMRGNQDRTQLPVLVARAIELEAGFRVGILPKLGGWDDQDPNDIRLIRLASNARATREAVERKKLEVERKRKQGLKARR
jgi:hypothetical protein